MAPHVVVKRTTLGTGRTAITPGPVQRLVGLVPDQRRTSASPAQTHKPLSAQTPVPVQPTTLGQSVPCRASTPGFVPSLFPPAPQPFKEPHLTRTPTGQTAMRCILGTFQPADVCREAVLLCVRSAQVWTLQIA